eukprot:gnl/TRDRNA2_/TRDRNA2_182660_c0_seq1.p1 gnl/TRDRNA2_/TRDRNA2_182660_c0~~gnl/TRDRNA2_/TRDRNA2_182660_c0_seq1.p1  ORF type:complete len:386 (+),score=97.30 gnl/TRDRNA2_/TRDRNA2_182660_c0_seq1:79-1236(+)
MGGFRSWLGSILSLAVFFSVRWYMVGLAAPAFVAFLLAFGYLWMFVLRVPELKGITFDEEEEDEEDEKTSKPAPPVPPPPKVPKPQKPAAAATPAADAAPVVASDTAAAVPQKTEVVDTAATSAASSVAPAGELSESAAAKPGASEDKSETTAGGAAEVHASQQPWPPGQTAAARGCDAKAPATTTDAESSDESEDERPLEWKDEDAEADPERAAELRLQGNEAFRQGDLHEAREAYSEAIHVSPSADKKGKAVLYCNRAACHQKFSRWEETVKDCTQAIELDGDYLKAYVRRCAANEALNKWHDALQDLNKAIELDPSLKSKEYKRQAVLEKRSAEQFEKDKEEMLGKLKDLGNMVLGKFGMSTENFAFEKDPNTGSYSIQYKS